MEQSEVPSRTEPVWVSWFWVLCDFIAGGPIKESAQELEPYDWKTKEIERLKDRIREKERDYEGLADKMFHQVGKTEVLRSQIKNLKDELAISDKQARTDSLTGLLNRRGLDQEYTRTVLLSKRFIPRESFQGFGFLFCDFDHFKHVNDTWGHAAGDEALQVVAQIAKEVLRDTDILCRFGGDEYSFILPNTNKEGSEILAKRFCDKVSANEQMQKLGVTISIGLIWSQRAESSNIEELRSLADKFMYQAKAAGGNQVQSD